jgi:hypothetical protein
LSQRIRSRTTAGATRKRAPARETGAASSASPSPREEQGPATLPVSPETLARTLRAVADELERDPSLAQRVASAITGDAAAAAAAEEESANSELARATRPHAARSFTPTIIPGISPDLGPGVPDPFALARRLGMDGLRAALAELRRGTLRAMIREQGIAPAAQVARVTDDTRLREMILAAVASAE